jgi:hypothetical protein
MARIIDYEQDEDKPFGIGTFRLDDGSEHYLDAPDKARDFLSQYGDESRDIASSSQPLSTEQQYTNATRRLAEGPNAPQLTPKAIDPKAIDPMRRAVAGPGGGEDLSSQPEDNQSRSDEPNQSLADDDQEDAAGVTASTPSDAQLREQQALQRVQDASTIVARSQRTGGGVDPVRMQREGVPVDRSITRKGGLPAEVYAQQAQDRATAYTQTNDVLAQNQQNEQAAKLLQYEQIQGETLAQKQANDKAQLELQRKQSKYEADRKWLDQDVDSYYDKAKPDPDRIFKDRGAFSNIASALAQFMGAYAAIVSGSPNFASQILDKKIERDVDAQMEDFRRGKMKRDSQLARMAERGMSLEQMKAGLRLQQEKVLEKEAKAAALAEGSRESMAAYNALMAQRQETFVKEENKYKTEALGDTTVNADVIQPKAARAPTPLEVLRQQHEATGLLTDIDFQAHGGAPAERAEQRADKRAAVQNKQDVKTTQRLTDYGNRRGTLEPAANEAQQAYETLAALKQKHGHLPGVGQWDIGENAAIQQLGSALGNDYMTDAGKAKQALKVIEGAAVRANKGSQTEGDVAREAEAMSGPNQSESQVWDGVQRLTKRATTPLDDLNATYSDVLPAWRERQDQTLLEKHKKRKAGEGASRGEAY